MYDFLWDSKPAKIKREIHTMDYEKGGLKMIDLEIFIKSLKICWIKRMIESEDNGILKTYILANLNPLEENFYLNVTSLKTIYIDLRKTIF